MDANFQRHHADAAALYGLRFWFSPWSGTFVLRRVLLAPQGSAKPTAKRLGLEGVQVASDVYDVATAPPGKKVQTAVSDGVSFAGGAAGFASGAAIGAMVPIPGVDVATSFVGGVVGGAVGSGVAGAVGDFVGGAAQSAWDDVSDWL